MCFPRLAGLFALAVLVAGLPAQAPLASPAVPPASPSPSASPVPANPTNAQLLERLKENALVFNVTASITGDEGIIWTAAQTRITVHGLGVTIKLESTDLLIMAELTPYRQTADTILLAIKNELWLRTPQSNSVQYFASLKSALVKLNAPVYFYPMGKASGDGRPVIKMDIVVVPYQDAKD